MKRKKFYMWNNNSVTAIVTEEVYEESRRRLALAEEAIAEGYSRPILPPARPVFAFSNLDQLKGWVTGDLTLMEELLHGHEIIRKSIYVPFSNGHQWRYKTDPEMAEEEWKFRTDLREAMDAFGLGRTTES